MNIKIICADITTLKVDAIVNAAAEGLTALFTVPLVPNYWKNAVRSKGVKQVRQKLHAGISSPPSMLSIRRDRYTKMVRMGSLNCSHIATATRSYSLETFTVKPLPFPVSAPEYTAILCKTPQPLLSLLCIPT